MNEQTDRNDKDAVKNHSATRRFRQRRVLVVALTCVAVLAAVVGLSSDRLSVNSDVQSPLVEEGKEEIAAPAANSAPEILRLTAATDRIAPLDVCELVCEAVDPDNDVLSYTWSSPQGEIHGEGSTIEWVSPGTEGLFRLSVTVNDGSGGAAEYSTSLRVRANCAPDIQSVSASADWVAPGASTYVSCAAEDADGDGITYEWAASAGEVFG